ncbi:MAG: hypothetical protein ABIH87_02820 [bacterium]
MTLRQYLILMSIGTAMCWAIWILVIINIDPVETKYLGLAFFYASLFLALSGTVSVIGFLVRKKINKNDEIVFHHVRHTFRQGVLISSLILLSLAMLQYKLLNWLTGMLIVLLFLILESLAFTNRRYKNLT